ncbi:MAG: orotidine-5'-phosphate decarboxylase [Candidatus Nanopelagicales bacterium]|nr:orotidine-5'-phosphate decarboxylase [Candidatus Nanopelagicales bacterium]MDP4825713.1 orotidine-5'-phosphate decarboxylase [Candidatus Nanopelagicales bacterium]
MTQFGGASPDVAPIVLALDAPDVKRASQWVRSTASSVDTFKIGLEVFLRDGASAVVAVREQLESMSLQRRIFLDLKLHDIPATVAGAARSVAQLAPNFLTVHASGGPAMIAAAADELPQTFITAVTVLTSLSIDDLTSLGFVANSTDDVTARDRDLTDAAVDLVTTWAAIAVEAGARAIVCSPREVAAVRQVVSPDVVLITPGVRPSGSALGDQKRVATPAQALSDGANLLVIGRPITAAAEPGLAAADIAAECRDALRG